MLHFSRNISFYLLLVCSTVLGCSSNSITEEYVDVPVTLTELEALKQQTGVTITKVQKKRRSSAGSCGHSPICILVLPVLIFDQVFPKKWDQYTVQRDGTTTYQASFSKKGSFIESTSWETNEVRHFQRFQLKELGHSIIVQRTRAQRHNDGTLGAATLVPILPQVDLIAQYQEKLHQRSSAESQKQLCVEGILWLQNESTELVKTCLDAQTQSDKMRALVLQEMCSLKPASTSKSKQSAQAMMQKLTYHQVNQSPGPLTAASAVACLSQKAEFPDLAVFGQQLAKGLCKANNKVQIDALKTAIATSSQHPKIKAAILKEQKSCPYEASKVLAKLLLQQAVSEPRIRRAIEQKDSHRQAILETLNINNRMHRKLVFEQLATDLGNKILVENIAQAKLNTLTNEELLIISKSYLFDRFEADHSRRGKILQSMHAAKHNSHKSGTSFLLTEIAKTQDSKTLARLHIAMAVLGQAEHQLLALHSLKQHRSYLPWAKAQPTSDDQLVGYGLKLLKCSHTEMLNAFDAIKPTDTPQPGVVCPKKRK